MKIIEIDDDLYQYIASKTERIGESASEILRRLLGQAFTQPLATANPKATAKVVGTIEPAAHKVASVSLDVAPANTVVSPVVAEVAVTSEAAAPVTSKKASKGSVFDYLNREELNFQKGVVGRFLFILEALHRAHKGDFAQILDIKGRDRLYFAKSEAELLAAGSSTNPKQIPNSGYWVITNSNSTRKKLMLHEVATVLGYSVEEAEKIRDMI